MEKLRISDEIKKEVISQYNSLKSIRKTKDVVNDILHLKLTYHNVRDIINDMELALDGTKEVIKDMNEKLKENHYEVRDGKYFFPYGKLKFEIDIELVDSIFYDYSRHGANMSGEEIRQKYKLKPGVFEKLKNALNLYKASHTVSPATLENATNEELQDKIESAIDSHIQDRYSDRFKTTFEKKKNEDYVKKSKILANYDSFLSYMGEFLQDYKPRDFKPYVINTPKNDNEREVTVAFSDIHIGKMNTDSVLKRIEKMGKDICKRPEGVVNLVCLGDLAEILIKGGAHSGQIETMEGVFGYDLMMKVVNVLEDLLINISNSGKAVRFYGTAGNHDSLEKNTGSFHGEGAMIIYEMVRRGVSGVVEEVNIIRDKWSKLDIDGMRFILNHGYGKDTSKPSASILWEYGDPTKTNIILQADKHHKMEIDPSDNATRFIVPALAGKGEYDKSLGVSSYPGYIAITKDEDNNTPISTTYRFPNL